MCVAQKQIRNKEISREDGEFKKRLLHTTVVRGVRLRLYEGGLHTVKREIKCWMCSVCQNQHSKIWEPSNARRIRLSKSVVQAVHLSDGTVVHRTPTNSFSFFDPGRLPHVLGMPELSTLEKTALAQCVVASEIHKVRNARDDQVAYRLKGHTLVFPSDSAGVLATRVCIVCELLHGFFKQCGQQLYEVTMTFSKMHDDYRQLCCRGQTCLGCIEYYGRDQNQRTRGDSRPY